MPDNKVNIVNGMVVGQFLGKPMQDAQATKAEDNEAYSRENNTVVYTKVNEEVLEKQPEPMGGGGVSMFYVLEDTLYKDPDRTVGTTIDDFVDVLNGFIVNGNSYHKITGALLSTGTGFTCSYDIIANSEGTMQTLEYYSSDYTSGGK